MGANQKWTDVHEFSGMTMGNHATTNENVWLTPKQLVEVYGRSISFWARLRVGVHGPRYRQLTERTITYWKPDIEEWLESRTVAGHQDPRCLAIKIEVRESKRRAADAKAARKRPKVAAFHPVVDSGRWQHPMTAAEVISRETVRIHQLLGATSTPKGQSVFTEACHPTGQVG